jgi:hypothetical protein
LPRALRFEIGTSLQIMAHLYTDLTVVFRPS